MGRSALAAKNPMRWSSGSAAEVVVKLQGAKTEARPIAVRVVGTTSDLEKFDSPAAAVAWLSGSGPKSTMDTAEQEPEPEPEPEPEAVWTGI